MLPNISAVAADSNAAKFPPGLPRKGKKPQEKKNDELEGKTKKNRTQNLLLIPATLGVKYTKRYGNLSSGATRFFFTPKVNRAACYINITKREIYKIRKSKSQSFCLSPTI